MAKKVLIIEDNEQNLYLMKYLLESRGYRTVTARDGHEAIAAARAEAPDVILLDIQLPTISGHEVARTLKADPLVLTIPIVAVTSYAMPGDREAVMAAGCTGYIEKPIDPSTFIEEMESFVSNDSAAPSDTRSEHEGDVR